MLDEGIYLKINVLFLRLFGAFPTNHKNPVLNAVCSFYVAFSRIFLPIFVISQYIEASRSQYSFTNVMANLAVSLLYFGTVLKITACRMPQIRKLMTEISEEERNIVECGNEDIITIHEKYSDVNNIRTQFIIWVTVITTSYYIFEPIITLILTEPRYVNVLVNNLNETYREKGLPFNSWYPFNKYKYYVLAYIFDFLGGWFGGGGTGSTDSLLAALMGYGITQLKILQYCFENTQSLVENLIGNDPNVPPEMAPKLVIGHLIGMHQKVIKYFESLNKIMSVLMMFDFMITVLQMAMIGIQVIAKESNMEKLFFLEFLLAMFVQLFVLYWYANEVLLESQGVYSAIWNSAWFEYDQETKQSLLIVVLRSQRPLKLMVGPFYNMSTETALSILRATYSYIAVLRQTIGRGT